MGIRVVKHLGARANGKDEAKVLIMVPTFPGERILHAELSGYFASGDASAIDQPGECNWYGISVPWHLALISDMLTGGSPEDLSTVADYDALFTQWLMSAGSDSDKYWGGDVDVDPEITTGEEGHQDEALIDSGPIGVHKWFSREVMMTPLAAEGNTTIRFGDSFYAVRKNIPANSFGSLNMFGMVRFESDVDLNFNIELDDGTSKEAMAILMAGDYTKAKAMVEGDTSALGDFIRTVLYGGDNYIETDTLKGPAGQAFIKASFVIQSAIGRGA